MFVLPRRLYTTSHASRMLCERKNVAYKLSLNDPLHVVHVVWPYQVDSHLGLVTIVTFWKKVNKWDFIQDILDSISCSIESPIGLPVQWPSQDRPGGCYHSSYTDIHGSIKYGLNRVLFCNRELSTADHYIRPLSEHAESYISIFNSHMVSRSLHFSTEMV